MLTPIHILKLPPLLFQMLTLSYMYVPVDNLLYLYIPDAVPLLNYVPVDNLLFLNVPDADPWWTVCLAMVGKFQIAASFAVIYVYAGELMPTVVRSQVQKVKKTKENARKRRHFVTSLFTCRPWEYLPLWRELAFSYFPTSTVWWVHSSSLCIYLFCTSIKMKLVFFCYTVVPL